MSAEKNSPQSPTNPPGKPDDSPWATESPLSASSSIYQGGDAADSQSQQPNIVSDTTQYGIVEQIGGGSMTIVYSARDTVLDRKVALKMLLHGADETMRERFRREARTSAMLEHPNIVRIYQVGQMPDTGLSYISMELVNGPSLAQFMEQQPVLTPGESAALLEPISRALAYAHEKGIVHRDVKPSNILLQKVDDNHPLKVDVNVAGCSVAQLLSDFGIARALDSPDLTSEGHTIGTPAFMSPEQCAGADEVDGRADIYAIGAVLYRCLVGRPPYSGSTTQILHSHVYDPLLIPKDIADKLPPSAVQIVQKAMSKDPSDRYQSALEMANDLATVSRSAAATPTSKARAAIPVSRANVSSTGGKTPSYILVPARSTSQPVSPIARTEAGGVPPTRTAPPATSPRRGGGRSRSGLIILSIALILLTVMLFATVIAGIGPLYNNGQMTPESTAANPVVIADASETATLTDSTAISVNPTQSTDHPAPAKSPTTEDAVPTTIAGVQVTSEDDSSVTETAQLETPAVTHAAVVQTQTSIPTEEPSASSTLRPSEAASSAPSQTPSSTLRPTVGNTATRQPSQTPTRKPTRTPSPTRTETPSVTPTLSLNVSPEFAWKNAQTLFGERDWKAAITWLIALQRSEPDFEASTVATMLAEAYVGLAQHDLLDEEYSQALRQLEKAVDSVEDQRFSRLYAAMKSYADASTGERSAALQDIQAAFAEYAMYYATEDRHCEAASQIEFASQLASDNALGEVLEAYQEACNQASPQPAPAALTGRILYSTNQGDAYNIYTAPVDGGPSRIVYRDGSQPSLSPDVSTIAFFSRRNGMEGLVMAPFRLSERADDGRVHLTNFLEDARDAAPSWNPQGDRIAYGSTNFGDGRSRIYLTWADGSRNTMELGLGKDPAWHPSDDVLIFNGTDRTGNNPGLWLMRSDGSDHSQLTDNGNDQRPVWFPDGTAFVFMSSGRDGNWELYRYEMVSGAITRLTNHFAQDGLPAVSPDGNYIAFMSDRDGYWSTWYIPTTGGEASRLADITGELPRWLEHSIQWIP